MSKKYKIILDEKQLKTLLKSTEAFSRICTGQIEYAISEGWCEKIFKLPIQVKDSLRDNFKAIANILSDGQFNGHNASYGIYNEEIDKHAATAYNINQVIRHHIWKENGSTEGPVSFTRDSSVCITNGETLIEIENIPE